MTGPYRQGDVLLCVIDEIPPDVKPVANDGDRVVVALGVSGNRRGSAGQELCGAFWPGTRAGYWGRSSVTANHCALSTINACASGQTPGSSSSGASATPERFTAPGAASVLRECY